jgi:hypothetical protein
MRVLGFAFICLITFFMGVALHGPTVRAIAHFVKAGK